MKKADKLLIGIVLALALLCLAWTQLNHKAGSRVVVSVDGQETADYDLNTDLAVDIVGVNGGINHLVIQDGTATVMDADCPDKLCVKQSTIRYDGETIVCLPHRVVVEIRGGEQALVDGVVG